MSEATIELLAAIGFFLSYYALSVEKNFKRKENYKPICDINDTISCSRAFNSKWGSLAGFPNPKIGTLVYAAIFLLIANNFIFPVILLSIISLVVSIFLAYIQYFKLKVFCFVCTSIYIVNILLVYFSITL